MVNINLVPLKDKKRKVKERKGKKRKGKKREGKERKGRERENNSAGRNTTSRDGRQLVINEIKTLLRWREAAEGLTSKPRHSA